MLKDIKSMPLFSIKNDFSEFNVPSYKALQVFKWLHKGVYSFDNMSDQNKTFQVFLANKYYIAVATIEKKLISSVDNTIKYLFRLQNDYIESVLMQYHHGYTLCISTQVGCKMGCSFCETGKNGLTRNLTASEMIAQIQTAQQDTGVRISNLVLMGMGEPLDNYKNVLRFLELLSSKAGIQIGMRRISLSTCGLVDQINNLAKKRFQLTLSISLHAPNNLIRSQIMPINKRFPIEELLKACKNYIKITQRRISFEYILMKGINDSDVCAEELAAKLKGMLCHINLIPINSIKDSLYKKTTMERSKHFMKILIKRGISATIRRTLGSDINASCGQLKAQHID